MGKEYRKYRDGAVHHVYCRALDGNVIFYSKQDCIFYLTLYYHLAKRYGIQTLAFSIMPNHLHSGERAPSKEQFTLFHCRLMTDFCKGYNDWHKRSGSLFQKSFGYAAKTVGKKVRDCISYVFNNPVVGKLCKRIEDYRWNLLAYRDNDHPFSEKIRLNKASFRFRNALSKLQFFFDRGIPLNPALQRQLFKGLSKKESAQLTDRIIFMHNCLDFQAIEEQYQGNMEIAIMTINANSGSEHDIPEDYENYLMYVQMMSYVQESGVDLTTCNFEAWPQEELAGMARMLSRAGFPSTQIRKFLHLPPKK